MVYSHCNIQLSTLFKQINFTEVTHPVMLSYNYSVHKQSTYLSIYYSTQRVSTFKRHYQAKKSDIKHRNFEKC